MCCLRGLHGPEHMVSTATLLLGLVHPRPSGHRGSPAHRARVSPGAPHFWAPVYPEQPGPQQVGQSTWPPLAHPPSTCLQLQAVYSELDQAKLELRSAQKDLQVADKEIAVRGTPGGNGVVCVPLRAELGWLCPEPAQSVELALGSLTLPRPVGRDVHLGLEPGGWHQGLPSESVWHRQPEGTREGALPGRCLGPGRGCRPCAAWPAVCVSLSSLAVCLDLTPQPFVNTFSFLLQEPEEKAHDAAGDPKPAAGGQ